MEQEGRSTMGGLPRGDQTAISRRAIVGSSGLAMLGLLAGSALGQQGEAEAERPEPPREIQERMERSRMFSERMRNAGSMEERMKIMAERNAEERKAAIEAFKEQLAVSDQEWAVIRPRIETVYDMMHPQPPFGRANARSGGPVEQRRRELAELLADKQAAAEEIKAKLAALRTARQQADQEIVKARQSLRQLMTLRQEAVLVLNGLLD